MLTMKTRYALEALTQLAQRPGATVLIADLAAKGRIPRKFLEAILRELKQHGLLTSQRGPGGGYALNVAAAEITLASIVQALHGALVPVPCTTRTPDLRCEACRRGGTCSARLVLEALHEATAKVLEGTTLADLARKTLAAPTPVALKYAI
jgi:Rrf2 family protein